MKEILSSNDEIIESVYDETEEIMGKIEKEPCV